MGGINHTQGLESSQARQERIEAVQKLSWLRNTLNCCLLWEANLIRANLSGTNFLEANLIGANLQKANLSGADLIRANLSGANFLEANLTPAQVKVACNWQKAIYSDKFRAELNSSPDPEEKVDCSRWSSDQD